LFMFRSSPLKYLPRHLRQSQWRLRLFSLSSGLPPPLLPPALSSQPSGSSPGMARAASFSPSSPENQEGEQGPGGRRVLVTSKKRKRRKGSKQPGGCSQKVEPCRNDHFGGCVVYFLEGVAPSVPFPVKNGGREVVEASQDINLPTGREAPSLPGCQKTRTSTFITSLLPLLPS
jgi:hypothetical protein